MVFFFFFFFFFFLLFLKQIFWDHSVGIWFYGNKRQNLEGLCIKLIRYKRSLVWWAVSHINVSRYVQKLPSISGGPEALSESPRCNDMVADLHFRRFFGTAIKCEIARCFPRSVVKVGLHVQCKNISISSGVQPWTSTDLKLSYFNTYNMWAVQILKRGIGKTRCKPCRRSMSYPPMLNLDQSFLPSRFLWQKYNSFPENLLLTSSEIGLHYGDLIRK